MSEPARFVYLLVPKHLEHDVLHPLRAHFAQDPLVEVIVERRTGDRRPGVDDRVLRDVDTPLYQERRAQTGPRGLPPLPPGFEQYAPQLRVVHRLPAVQSGLADVPVEEVIDRAVAGDPDAHTEIYWRTFERVHRRLSAHLQEQKEVDDAVKEAFGDIFDRLPEFDARERSLHGWLDRTVDAYVDRRRHGRP